MPAANKLDLYKEHRAEYITPKKPVILETKPAQYLSVAGRGAPASADFQNAVGALYGAAFTIKMAKKLAGRDYKVCPLEGLWWGAREGEEFFTELPETWNWQLIIRVPDFIKQAELKVAIQQLEAKGRGEHASRVKLEKVAEGKCVQALHIGPYGAEERTIDGMKEFAAGQGLSFCGRHHEIYLSDPRRVPATRLRTILRHPVK